MGQIATKVRQISQKIPYYIVGMLLKHEYRVYSNYVNNVLKENKSRKNILSLYFFYQEINKILPFLGLANNSMCFSVTVFFSAANDCRQIIKTKMIITTTI